MECAVLSARRSGREKSGRTNRGFTMKAVLRISCLALLCVGSAAEAEKISVTGWYAATSREVAQLQSLGVDDFTGNEGPSLAAAIERSLSDARDRSGAQYFHMRSRWGNGGAPDGVIDGSMQVRVDNSNYKNKVRRCAENNNSTDCPDDKKVDIEQRCTRRVISATADIRIVRVADDRLIYSRSMPQRNEVSWCQGDSLPADVDVIVRPFFDNIAREVRRESTPFGATEKIRIREDRKNMAKVDSDQMKALIKITDKQPAQACAGWKAMADRGFKHPTLSFNLGLCAESRGELDTALAYYQDVFAASSKPSGDVRDALDRVRRHIAGKEDDAARMIAKQKPGT